jgi:dienelactone hydrolase
MTWAAPDATAGELRTIKTRDLNTHYEFKGYATLEEWEAWAAYLRRHILMSTGLWPTPERCDLRPEIFGRIKREGYSVEKVFFRSYPGFLVTGNLYHPLGRQGPFPAIITPHGHWATGRLANEELGSVPGRCINLARQGYVVFSYDMVGYNDSKQVTHGFGGQRQALWGESLMGLQLWNSFRAMDFILSLPEVDPKRVGCTGASGGGTQTFMLMGVEPRLTAAVPAVMVSAYMQGGCLCENSPNLRVDTFNTEIAALMAPRPLLLISATGDWTSHNPTEEYPDIKSIYALYGAEDKVACVQIDAPHNYNKDSREAMYAFFGKWLLGAAEAPKEQPFEPEENEDLLVFAGRELPKDAWTESELVQHLIDASEAQLEAHRPRDRRTLRQFREVYGSALAHSLNLLPAERLQTHEIDQVVLTTDPYYIENLTLAGEDADLRILATLVAPAKPQPKRPTVVLASDGPRQGLLDETGHAPGPLVKALVDKGRQVLLVDPFLVGDNQLSADSDRRPDEKFFDTYNRTDLALRVQDIVAALLYAPARSGGGPISLIGRGDAGLWCLLASAAGLKVQAVVADLAGFDATSDDAYLKRLYTPQLRRAGDLRTAGALWAPSKLLVHNVGTKADLSFAADAYAAAGAPKKLRIEAGEASAEQIAEWVTGR